MAMNDTEDIRNFLKEAIPEKLIVDEIQENTEPCGNIFALKDKKRILDNLVHNLECRLMLIESRINGTDLLSKDGANDTFNQNETSNKKKECEEISEEIKNLCDKIEADYDVLQLKQNLLLQKVQQLRLKKQNFEEIKQKKWGKLADILGPHMPQQMSQFEEQLKAKVDSAQQVYHSSSTSLKSLQVKTCELKATCEELLKMLQEKESECKILKEDQEEKISRVKEDFDISEKMTNIYESFLNATIQKSGKNFVQVEMMSDIGESKSLLVTFYFKPSAFQGISLEDIHVDNNNLYITDCVENGRSCQNIPGCLNSIRERWHYYLTMVEHLKDIQERLPVDWIQQENKLRVVVGKNANVICTLQLPSAQQSCVSLLDVRGGDSEMKMDLLKPPNPAASLQEWIEYLEGQFS